MMSVASDWRHGRIESIKGESTLAVVIPARDEEGTIGQVVSAIAAELGEIVDELVRLHPLLLHLVEHFQQPSKLLVFLGRAEDVSEIVADVAKH